MTQVELAADADVPVVTISRIENNHATPRPATVRKLAKALGVAPAWLLFGDDDEGEGRS